MPPWSLCSVTSTQLNCAGLRVRKKGESGSSAQGVGVGGKGEWRQSEDVGGGPLR